MGCITTNKPFDLFSLLIWICPDLNPGIFKRSFHQNAGQDQQLPMTNHLKSLPIKKY